MKGPQAWRTAAVLFAVCFVLQGIGALRYISRLPQDWMGIALYSLSSVLFAVAAIGFYLKWRAEGQKGE